MAENKNNKINKSVPMEVGEHLGSTEQKNTSLPSDTGRDVLKREMNARKRSCVDLDSSLEDDWKDALQHNDKVVRDLQYVEEIIRKCCENDPSKRVTKALTNEIMGHVSDLIGVAMGLLTRNSYLKGIIDCKDAELSCVNKKLEETRQQQTYASVVKKAEKPKVPLISGINKRAMTLAQVAIIAPPVGKELDVDETKRKVMELIDPGKEKLKIKGVRKRADGKIVVETSSPEDLSKILDHEALKLSGFTAIRSGALNPKIVLYDVPRNIEKEELTEIIYGQNEDLLEGLTKEVFREAFIPRFMIGRKEGQCTNWVIEVTPNIRNVLRSNERSRLYLQWQSCKIEDYRGVTRCYKCQSYGHVSKFCREEEQVCSFCAKTGHKLIDCPEKKRNGSPTCAACKRAKKKADHSINDKSCPAYKSALDRIIQRTDYGIQ